LTQLYATFLALVTVIARRVRASVISFHLSSILLGIFFVYAYRNVWPLLTFSLTPVDAYEGALLWIKIGLLAFAAIVVPLLVPSQYIPIDPKVKLSPTSFSISDSGLRTPSRLSTLNRLPHFYL
jgi:hypothetical protein